MKDAFCGKAYINFTFIKHDKFKKTKYYDTSITLLHIIM